MCFTPQISITTALIEFFSAAWIYYRYPKSKLAIFFIVDLILLGVYQLSEFMLCVTNNIKLWGKIGFITYTIIPPFILYFAMNYKKRSKLINSLIFLPAILFIIFAIFDKNLITQGTCSTLFVEISNRFNSPDKNPLSTFLYQQFYLSYIALTTIFLFRRVKEAKNKTEVYTYIFMIITCPLIILPPIFLMIFLPSLGLMKFPSIYCQFAMFITLCALISLHYENKFTNSKN